MERKLSKARLLIADDHKLLAEACKSILEPEFEVVGIVTDGRSIVSAAAALKPDVIILDIAMPQLNGLDAADQIKHKQPYIKLVFLTMNISAEVAAEAFRRGASGFVLKQSAAEELVVAVRKVIQGASYLSPLIARETVTFLLNQRNSGTRENRLTKRQSEILQLLSEGMSMKQVAGILDVKPGTVAFHKYRMMETLNVKTNAELLEYAIKRQMTTSN
jgi:DNA-binding NarL/FixJ family response regulator